MSKSSNKDWADSYTQRKAPGFKYRWEYFDELVATSVPEVGRWLDIGCGDNRLISELATPNCDALGIDIERHPDLGDNRFLQASIYDLPIENDSVDLITLRFLAEHLEQAQRALLECSRVLCPSGRVIVMTTNKNSPWIWPLRILPHSFKHWLANRLFGQEAHDLQPTYHRLNSRTDFEDHLSGLIIERFEYIQDSNHYRRLIFRLHIFWHRFTGSLNLKQMRTNIIAVLKKP